MNRIELAKQLHIMEIPMYMYNLDGKGRNDERYCLEFTKDQWEVYYLERGVKTCDLFFNTEDEACQYIYDHFYNVKEKLMKTEMNYIPLGSVVLLKGGSQKLLIIGRAILVQNNGKQFFFDYGAVAYPEGLIGDRMAYFNHDAISMVVFEGYKDVENENMIKNIQAYLDSNPNIVRGSRESWNVPKE